MYLLRENKSRSWLIQLNRFYPNVFTLVIIRIYLSRLTISTPNLEILFNPQYSVLNTAIYR